MKAEDFKNMVREIIREEMNNLVTEWDRKNPDDDPSSSWSKSDQAAVDKQRKDLFNKTIAKQNMLSQKIKYKDADGKEHEATVKTLLGYDKDHPGRKLAARAYAQYKAKNEEICEGEGCLDEKSVPQPYDRKGARKMSKSQIEKRRKIGRDMMGNEKTVSKFRKKYGDEWKDYLWAAASSAAFRQSGSTKSDDTRKK